MTKYGSTDEIQKLAWGGTKASTPEILASIQNTVTTLINNILNRNEDFATVPTAIGDIANLVGSEILRNRGNRENEMTIPQILDMIKVLLMNYKDQAPASEHRWGTVWYV
jgi:hypothetical protein